MMGETVGASIVRIITESLYDKPIVVFREYIQNSVDAFACIEEDETQHLAVHVWQDADKLFFLDNGSGISEYDFEIKMTSIARSTKSKVTNIGYKGIGRLSGLAYCNSICFINIVDYKNRKFQKFQIDGKKYREIQKESNFNQVGFNELMETIGSLDKECDAYFVERIIEQRESLFDNRNTGFLVILEGITSVLKNVIKSDNFNESLSWLLPIPFKPEVAAGEPFSEISTEVMGEYPGVIPAKAYPIYFDKIELFRPLEKGMLRKNVCLCNLGNYAVCIHTFSSKRIEIDKKNGFSGIRIYIDNMLLCDENELIPILHQYGMISHGLYEMIQTVKGIGALIYVVDKIGISTNARRTFIDVTDQDSLDFLALIGQFVEDVYRARYALSDYHSAKRKADVNKELTAEKLKELRDKAQDALNVLAREDIAITEPQDEVLDFNQLTNTEKKKLIKSKLSKELNSAISKYLSQTSSFDLESCFNDFRTWLQANYK